MSRAVQPTAILSLLAASLASLVLCCHPQGGEEVAEPPEVAAPALAPNQLHADVLALADDAMQGRATGSEGAERARSYLTTRLRDAGTAPLDGDYLHRFRSRSGVEGTNVVATVPGSSRPDLYLLFTAHYDHLGVRGGQIHNGADDNASGVATLLFVAERLAREPLLETAILVAFDAEELGLIGARAFVDSPPVPLEAISLIINLDMVGRDDNGSLFASGVHHHPWLEAPLRRAAESTGVELRFGHDRPDDGAGDWTYASDHGPFFQAGVPFVYFGVEDHADYHRPSDDADRIDRAFHDEVSELILAATRELDLSAVDRVSSRTSPVP